MIYAYTPIINAPDMFTIEVNDRNVKVTWIDEEKFRVYLSDAIPKTMEDILYGMKKFFHGVLHWEENKMHRKWVVAKILKEVSQKSPKMYDMLMK